MSRQVYTPPSANLEVAEREGVHEFFRVSVRKLVLMYVLTCGWYGIYWHYQQWSCNKRFTGSSIMPVMRMLFGFLFFFSLCRKVDNSLRRQDLGRMPYWLFSALASALIAAGSTLVSYAEMTRLGQPGSAMQVLLWTLLFTVLQAVNLAVVQRQMNIAALDPAGESNASINGLNVPWIIIGLLGWLGLLSAVKPF